MQCSTHARPVCSGRCNRVDRQTWTPAARCISENNACACACNKLASTPPACTHSMSPQARLRLGHTLDVTCCTLPHAAELLAGCEQLLVQTTSMRPPARLRLARTLDVACCTLPHAAELLQGACSSWCKTTSMSPPARLWLARTLDVAYCTLPHSAELFAG